MKIGIVGTGNVAYHLAKRLSQTDIEITGIYAHSEASAKDFAMELNLPVKIGLSDIEKADIFILAVRDSAITEVASHLRGKTLIHTAGAVDMQVLSFYSQNYGVFYPFQTFRKIYEVNWEEVPVFLESCCQEVYDMLLNLADKMGSKTFSLSSEKRKYLHLSGVLTNNFVNHLLFLSKKILEDHGLDFQWVFPLLRKTVENAEKFDPYDIQTGPARRNDTISINQHLQLLSQYPDIKEVYNILSQSIRNLYNKDE